MARQAVTCWEASAGSDDSRLFKSNSSTKVLHVELKIVQKVVMVK